MVQIYMNWNHLRISIASINFRNTRGHFTALTAVTLPSLAITVLAISCQCAQFYQLSSLASIPHILLPASDLTHSRWVDFIRRLQFLSERGPARRTSSAGLRVGLRVWLRVWLRVRLRVWLRVWARPRAQRQQHHHHHHHQQTQPHLGYTNER